MPAAQHVDTRAADQGSSPHRRASFRRRRTGCRCHAAEHVSRRHVAEEECCCRSAGDQFECRGICRRRHRRREPHRGGEDVDRRPSRVVEQSRAPPRHRRCRDPHPGAARRRHRRPPACRPRCRPPAGRCRPQQIVAAFAEEVSRASPPSMGVRLPVLPAMYVARRHARHTGRRRRRTSPAPLITPWLSSVVVKTSCPPIAGA